MATPTTDELRQRWIDEDYQRTHWEGCALEHMRCAISYLCDEVDRLNKTNATSDEE